MDWILTPVNLILLPVNGGDTCMSHVCSVRAKLLQSCSLEHVTRT